MTGKNIFILFGGVVIGSLIGVGTALLMAPRSGEETRTLLKAKGSTLIEQAEEGVVEASQRAQERVAIWENKGKAALEHTAETIYHRKDNLLEAMNQSKDNLVHTVSRKGNNIAESVVG